MNIKDYEKIAADDLNCDITNINSYCLRLGSLRAKWASFLYKEETILNEIEGELSSLYKDKLLYYTYDSEIILEKKNIESVINGDNEYILKKKEYASQKSIIKFINEVINALAAQSFYLNTCVKHLMWQSGE